MSAHRTGVLVVGASLAGLRVAEQVRAAGWTGALTVVGDEPHLPYNRPPLSKDLLARSPGPLAETHAETHASVALRRRSSVADVDWRLGVSAAAASLADRTVTLADGDVLRFDALAVTIGVRARRLPLTRPAAGVHTLRTLDDALALRAELTPGRRLVVVGAGFIGCEVAATAVRRGCRVTVVEPLDVPLGRVLGPEVGGALQAHHEARGVRFVLGATVDAYLGEHRPSGVRIRYGGSPDPTTLDADVVLECVGTVPNVEWLEGNGLDLRDGVRCDGWLRVEGPSGPVGDVVAAGDVARFPHPGGAVRGDGTPRRIEHWGTAGETARQAAATLVAQLHGEVLDRPPLAFLTSFWSDQFSLRLQSFGLPSSGDAVEVLEGSLTDLDGGVAVGYRRGAALAGVVLLGVPANRHPQYRSLLTTIRPLA